MAMVTVSLSNSSACGGVGERSSAEANNEPINLHHAFRIGRRGIDDPNPQLGRGVDIDGIVPHAVPSDDGKFRRGLHDLPRDRGVANHKGGTIADYCENAIEILRLRIDQFGFFGQHLFAGLMDTFNHEKLMHGTPPPTMSFATGFGPGSGVT
jgi:hypothetical protein